MERLIAIAKPLEYRHRLTVRRAIYIEAIVLFLAAICSVENLVMWYYVLAHDDGVSKKAQIATKGLLAWEEVQNQAEVFTRGIFDDLFKPRLNFLCFVKTFEQSPSNKALQQIARNQTKNEKKSI